jgi:imidazoleglycerol-phosphate dehydratase
VKRATSIERESQETKVAIDICIDGTGKSTIDTPLPFLNQLLDAFARHGLIDLTLHAQGEDDGDGHATIEDVGRALGAAFRIALGDRSGMTRYGPATSPRDEPVLTGAVDFCG